MFTQYEIDSEIDIYILDILRKFVKHHDDSISSMENNRLYFRTTDASLMGPRRVLACWVTSAFAIGFTPAVGYW